jgi:hypothetical protein
MRQRGDSLGRGRDIVILVNRRNLWQLLSEHKHLRKNSCTASCPLLQLRLCQSSVQLLGITLLGPFCGLRLCQTQTRSLFNTPACSPQNTKREKRKIQALSLLNYLFCYWEYPQNKSGTLWRQTELQSQKQPVASSLLVPYSCRCLNIGMFQAVVTTFDLYWNPDNFFSESERPNH